MLTAYFKNNKTNETESFEVSAITVSQKEYLVFDRETKCKRLPADKWQLIRLDEVDDRAD